MVDREGRNRFAELLRGLFSGVITNDEFEEKLPDSHDRAISGIYIHGAMWLYSHFETHKLIGDFAQPKEEWRNFARWILFLKTDLEYEWQHRPVWMQQLDHLMKALTLGRFPRKTYVEVAFAKSPSGDVDVWPFFRKEDLSAALRNPPYLCGKNTAAFRQRA